MKYDQKNEVKVIDKESVILMGHSMGALSATAAAATYLYDEISLEMNESNSEVVNENAFKSKNITLVLVSPAFSFTKEQRSQSANSNQSSLSSVSNTSIQKTQSLDILKNVVTHVKKTLHQKSIETQPLNKKPYLIKKNVTTISTIFKNGYKLLSDFLGAAVMLPVKIVLRR